ncbi:MAG: alpha-glucosidase C-terminal domain-containing protein [Candidatus Lindowbacteria bacterium]|nr:alpha-glucosidase C-terminal domain-containing protein [Candidatus Lindowbacteria bacterium]
MPAHVLSFFREHSSQRILVCLNFSHKPANFSVSGGDAAPHTSHARTIMRYPEAAASPDLHQIQLAPYGILIAECG